MSNVGIDTKGLDELFNKLDKSNRDRVLFAAVKEGGKALLQSTKETAIRKIGQGATSTNHFKKSIVDNFSIYYEKDYIETIVSVNRGFGHIFEGGTDDRYQKNGRYTGRIQPYGFFKEARQNSDNVIETMIRTLDGEMKNLM